MTSAADFTREPPQQPPKDYTVIKDLARVFVDVCTSADAVMVVMFCLIIFTTIYGVAGLAMSSSCETHGLLAGAKTGHDVRMSFTFHCVAEVDGKWVEVQP